MQKLQSPSRPERLDELLDPQMVARLGALDLTSRKVLAGKMKGERRSKRRGQSVEFADHRQYVVGDDLRHIDWNIFGRLDRLFLKLFLEEEDLSLHVVLDATASLDCGQPSKFLLAQRLACALGYIGLVNLHRVTVTAVGGLAPTPEGDLRPQLMSAVRDLRGRRRLQDLSRFLLQLEPGGPGGFTEAAKRIALTRKGKGVMVVISDFFVKEGYENGLRLLLGRGYEVYAVQVLSPQELEPDVGGDLRLKDCEDGDVAEVTITAPLLKRYKQMLAAYCARLRDFCAARSIVLQTVPSTTPVDALVLDYLRRKGLVR
ncbi:MAG: DUF58 domain-containing protein [Phycisphaeraceae bacterium]|nr:DUF58 domain-containing protein [Phycisphaeraceae bacterium]